jgi:hypothetical protein
MSERDICLLIGDAFSDVPYPGDDNIGLIGPHTGTIRAAEVKTIFKGKHWEKILQKSNKWFRSHYWVFSSLSPDAYHFFLPAFLIKSVTDEDDIDLVPEWIVYNLMPPTKEHAKNLMPQYVARIAKFNLKQKRVLVRFLRFLKKGHNRNDFFVKCIDEAISALKQKGSKGQIKVLEK